MNYVHDRDDTNLLLWIVHKMYQSTKYPPLLSNSFILFLSFSDVWLGHQFITNK